MLPTEAFADAVAFLRLYDPSALVVANSLCSSLAAKASTTIRWEDFSGLYFYIYNERIDVYCGSDCYSHGTLLVAQLRFASENETIEFITAAFPNCVFEKLAILRFAGFQIKPLLDAIGQVAGSVIISGVFIQTRAMTLADTLNIVRKFRRVKVLHLNADVSDDKVNEIVDFYRASGIQELRYFRGLDDEAPQVITFD